MIFRGISAKLICVVLLVNISNLNYVSGSLLCSARDTISYGDDPNENLLIAAYNNDYHKVYVFLTNGAKVNTQSENGYTALMYAVGNQNIDMVKLLVDKGADVNFVSSYNCEPPSLVQASKQGNVAIVSYLLDHEARTTIKDCNGITALHYAAFYNDTLIVEVLLRHKVNINDSTNQRETALMYAAFNGSTEAATMLIEAGADVNRRDNKGYTPLMMACQNGHYGVAVKLLQNWAEINQLNKDGYSSLSLAIMNRFPDMVDLLILNGADVNETNTLSLNPMALAKIRKQAAITDSLKKAGAKRNYLPYFHHGGFGLVFNFNNKDFMMGFTIPIIDIKYNIESSLHFYFRPKARAILQKRGNNAYVQYWERRHMIGTGLTKNFFFVNRNNRALGINAGANYDFHFGRFRGTDIPINNGFKLSPCIGIIAKSRGWDFRIHYNYTKLNVTGLKNWYIGFSISTVSFGKPNLNKRLVLD